MFLLKKIIAPLFLPTTMIFIFLLVGICLLWFTRKQKSGKIFVSISFVLLAFFSYSLFADPILRGIENDYSPLMEIPDSASIKWVVVLGGGLTSDPKLQANDQLSKSSLARLVEGIRIHNHLTDSRLLLSGGAVFNTTAEATTMADVAENLGVDKQDIVTETISKDTKDQAREIKKIVGTGQFILVSSAAHLPRVMALFGKRGLNPVPAPTDFWVKEGQGIHPAEFYPGANELRKVDRAVHEYLGLLWAKLRKQI